MKKLILYLCLASPVFAAVSAATQWEVRTTGAATNGGGYSTGGTDMSVFDNKNAAGCSSCQSATVNISTTDAVTNNTTTVTSATGNFSSALVGNVIYLAGTGTTTGWYQVASVTNSTTIEVDRATGSTGGTGVTMNIGGAVSLPSTIVAAVAAGNTIWIKATATYTISVTPTTSVAGTSGLPVTWEGYTTTRGDKGRPTFQISGSTITGFNINSTLQRLRNLNVNCNSQTASRGLTIGGAQAEVENIAISGGCATHGINSSGNGIKLVNVSVTGATALPVTVTGGSAFLLGVSAYANTASGIIHSGGIIVCVRCIAYGNTGATSDGFQSSTATSTAPSWWLNSIAMSNGRDGFRATAAATTEGVLLFNSVFYGNTGYGTNSATTDWTGKALATNFNAFGANGTAARNQMPTGANDVTLTGDPFTNAASGDFSPNSTAGAGAAIKAAGFPGALLYGGTGYLDIGALQAQCTGGGGGSVGCSVTFIQ
jgi:hypothetical protein